MDIFVHFIVFKTFEIKTCPILHVRPTFADSPLWQFQSTSCEFSLHVESNFYHIMQCSLLLGGGGIYMKITPVVNITFFALLFKKLVWVELVIIFTGIVYLRILSLDLMGLSLIFILLSQVFRGSCDEFRHFKSCDTRSHEGRVTRPDSETEDLHYRQSQWQDHPLSTHATDGLRVLAQVMNRCRVKRFLQFYLWF